MDDQGVRALAELQVHGALSDHVQLRGMATCRYCHQGFGSASLSIHVRRCRALLPSEEGVEVDTSIQPIRKKKVRSLVDLCLQFVTKHFESVCMDKIVAFPEAEVSVALIASMPSNLLHRMVINLVKESKQVKSSNRELRATNEALETALDRTRCDVTQLESARDRAAISRAKMAERQQFAERLQQELEVTKTALALAEAETQRFRSETNSAKKKLLRLETKMNTLNAEKVTLKKATTEAQRREMDITRQLALTKKALATTKNTRRVSRRCNERVQHSGQQFLSSRGPLMGFTSYRPSITYRERPRADGSKIPYPASLKESASQLPSNRTTRMSISRAEQEESWQHIRRLNGL